MRPLLLLMLLLLCGCAHQPVGQLPDLPPVAPSVAALVEDEAAIFALPARFRRDQLGPWHSQPLAGRLDLLRQWLSSAEGFRPAYDSSISRTASQTLQDNAANCISLAIVTHAIASELGLEARFQMPDVPWLWDEQAGLEVINSHINVAVSLPAGSDTQFADDRDRSFVVDLTGADSNLRLPYQPLSRQRVIAMFYNNRAAEALGRGQHQLAYAYAVAAHQRDSDYAAAYATLGVLLRPQAPQLAAEVYRAGLSRAPDNLLLLTNLHSLLRQQGIDREARTIAARLTELDAHSPFQAARLGDQALSAGHYRLALHRYGEALRQANYVHQFYFGVARAYYGLGDYSAAEQALTIARDLSGNRHDRLRYQAKLLALSQQP